jgi:hypothetical protein
MSLSKRRTQKRKPGKWIYKKTRLAIYERDNYTCQWCGRKHEKGCNDLSLDHLTPWILWGHDRHNNLVTCCRSCNSKRGDKKLNQWYKVLESEFGKDLAEIENMKKYVRSVRRRSDSNIQKYRDIITAQMKVQND